MRILIFKVWDMEKERMSEPFSLGALAIKWSDGDIDMPIPFAVAKSGRFVFLQHIIGEIYEGSIVELGNNGKQLGVVKWYDSSCQYKISITDLNPSPANFAAKKYISPSQALKNNGKVIGDIFQNPELIAG